MRVTRELPPTRVGDRRATTRHLLLTVLLASVAWPASTQRQFIVEWAPERDTSSEQQLLTSELDLALRAELNRRLETVVRTQAPREVVLLRPSLEVRPHALTLKVVGLRHRDHALLGTVSTTAAGTNRGAMIQALAFRACDEVEQL